MPLRVAIVTETLDRRIAAVRDTFQACAGVTELQVLRYGETPRARRGFRKPIISARASRPQGILAALLAYRPGLVICRDTGPMAIQAAAFRRLSPRSRLLVCETDPARKSGLAGRIVRRMADAMLSEEDPVAQAVAQLRLPSSVLAAACTPHDLDAFLACPRSRSETQARRIVFAGDLSPQSGAADLMIAVASWAERNPNRLVDIWWVGEGDLAGVLDAQPLPPGVTQRFLGALQPEAMAATFAQCGILAVPSLVDARHPAVLEALATGLPVLGSRLDRSVRRWIQDDVNGWLFNVLEPEDMTRALSRALDSSLAALDQMRERAQATVRPVASPGLTERLARAFAAGSGEFPSPMLAQAAP